MSISFNRPALHVIFALLLVPIAAGASTLSGPPEAADAPPSSAGGSTLLATPDQGFDLRPGNAWPHPGSSSGRHPRLEETPELDADVLLETAGPVEGGADSGKARFDRSLAVDFYSRGLWVLTGTSSWTRVTSWETSSDSIRAYRDGFVANFGYGRGIWYFDGNTWTRVYEGWHPEQMREWAGGLALYFGSTKGLYSLDNGEWTNISAPGWNVTCMQRYGGGLAVGYSNTNALWLYRGPSGWLKLADRSPGNMIVWNGNLVASFGTQGLWIYKDEQWTRLNSWPSGALSTYGGSLAVDFGHKGLWLYDGSSWLKLTDWNARALGEWNPGLAMGFGDHGLWRYDSGSWAKATDWEPRRLIGF